MGRYLGLGKDEQNGCISILLLIPLLLPSIWLEVRKNSEF